MNRIDRISAILITLQSRSIVTADEIAERFGVSTRTIYRDIATLNSAGVPIYSEAGVGYSLMDGYRLPPLMFTESEAVAFLIAEKFIEQLTDDSSSFHFRKGMDKIRAVLRRSDKDTLHQLNDNIGVYRSENQTLPKFPNLIHEILSSITNRRSMQIKYWVPSRDDHTERLIEPLGVVYVYPQWHVAAYCHLRGDYRNFRLDRIEQIETTEQEFSKSHPTLEEFISSLDDSKILTKVILHVPIEIARHRGDEGYFLGRITENKISHNVVEQVYMTHSIDQMARWVLSNSDTIKIIEPQELKEKIKIIINSIKL